MARAPDQVVALARAEEPDGVTGVVRPALPGDLRRLQEIEIAAGSLFASVGMQAVADDPPAALEVLATYQRDGRAWVAIDGSARLVGYALALEVDGLGHLEQLSVEPAAGRQGWGAALIGTVLEWATGRGAPAVTLSTFVDVAWNAPYYARFGFRALSEQDLTPGLLRLREHEVTAGLDVSRRVFMRREA